MGVDRPRSFRRATRPGACGPAAVLLSLALAACGGPTAEGPRGDGDRVPRQRSVDAYTAMLEAPGRRDWQRPEALVEALDIEPGMRVADVGTGSGYFLPLLARAVGPEGAVVAQDVDEEMVAFVARRAEREGLHQVETRVGRHDDPNLDPGAYDLVLVVDVYHHVSDPEAFLAGVARSLRPTGRFVVVDFPPGDRVPEEVSGPDHRIARQRVLEDARAAGLVLHREHDFLPYQFFLEFTLPPTGQPRR